MMINLMLTCEVPHGATANEYIDHIVDSVRMGFAGLHGDDPLKLAKPVAARLINLRVVTPGRDADAGLYLEQAVA